MKHNNSGWGLSSFLVFLFLFLAFLLVIEVLVNRLNSNFINDIENISIEIK